MNKTRPAAFASFFLPGKLSKPSGQKDIAAFYAAIRDDAQLASLTVFLQQKHAEGLKSGFAAGKAEYQHDKKALLSSVTFAGNVDRTSGAENKNFIHSGLVNFDIDENTPEQLKSFFDQVKREKMNYVEAAARSVSGFATGAMWLNVRVEIPATFDKKLLKLVGAEGETYFEAVCKLHAAYASAFAWQLEKQTGIIAGAAKDLKRARYLTADPEIYVNLEADTFTLKTLAYTLEQQKREEKQTKQEFEVFEREAWSCEGDVFERAERFAQKKHTYENRQLYISRLSIALNCYGVPYDKAESYINKRYPDYDTARRDGLRYPYKAYRKNFGAWSYQLKPKDATAEGQLVLQPGQRLSDLAAELTSFIAGAGRVDLKAGTGTGKNYAVVKEIAPRLKALNGCRSVIVCSLNAKAEKDAEQYGLEYVTGERLKVSGPEKKAILERALSSDVVLVNQDSFARLAKKLVREGEKLNIFIDESQTLVSGMAYRSDVLSALMQAVESHAKTVTLLSGTPKPYFSEIGFKRIEVVQADRSDIEVTILTRLKSLEMTVFRHCQTTDFDQVRLVVKLQSKAAIRRTKALLVDNGFRAEEVACLYSEKSVKESQDYKQFKLAKQGEESFSDQVKVVLCTSFINEGLDIYSSRPLHLVNIEKMKTFAVDELVQFADRWRTDQPKTLFSYHPEDESKKPNWSFNALHEFQELLSFWQGRAEGETAELNSDKYSRSVKLSLKTAYTSSSSHLQPCTSEDGKESLQVNVLALMHEAEQQKEKNTTTAAGWLEIAAKYPYFKMMKADSVQPVQLTEEEEAKDKAMKAKDRLAVLDIQDQLATLYQNDKEVLLQAVGMLTEDHELKSKTDFSEDRKEAVNSLVSAWPAVFKSDFFGQAEKLVQAHFRLLKLLLPDQDIMKMLFEVTGDGRQKLASSQKLSAFFDDFKTLLLLLLFDLSAEYKLNFKQSLKALDIRQARDGKTLLTVVKAIESQAGLNDNRLTALQLFRAVKQAAGNSLPGMTQKKAMHLSGILFRLKKVTGRTGAAYEIGEKRSFDRLLEDRGLDKFEIFSKLMQVIDFQGFEATILSRYKLINKNTERIVALSASLSDDRIKKLEEGKTVVLNVKTDKELLVYAAKKGLYQYCGRPHFFGNPFAMKNADSDEERAEVIEKHKAWLSSEAGAEVISQLHLLKGKALGCFCYPRPCHCDHLAELADRQGP